MKVQTKWTPQTKHMNKSTPKKRTKLEKHPWTTTSVQVTQCRSHCETPLGCDSRGSCCSKCQQASCNQRKNRIAQEARRSGMEGQRRNACDPPNTKENVPTKGKLIHSSWGSRFHPFRAPQHHNSAVVFPCSSFPFPQQLEYPRLSSCCWRLFPSLVTPLAQWVLQALVHPVVHVTCSNVTDSFQTSAGFPVSWTVDSQCRQGEKLKCSF